MDTLFGRKVAMSQKFDEKGNMIPVTLLEVGPCTVVAVKTAEKDGYVALVMGWGISKQMNKPMQGLLKGAKLEKAPLFMREVRVSEIGEVKAGDVITASQVFQKGDAVSVSGTSKGKGFQGGMKLHGFRGGPRTHGQSDRQRAPGSIGQTTTPGRVYRGKRMAGHMGTERVTVSGLTVFAVDSEKNIVLVTGPVPGANKGFIEITKQGK